MRSFIALEINEAIRSKLGHLQARLKTAGADVTWVAPHAIHLTLKFLGDIPGDTIEKIRTILDDIARTVHPFEIDIGSLGVFPKPDFPRVVWVGLEKGAQESTDLAENIEERLESIGFPKEERSFKPHLTIGRVRTPRNKDALKAKILSTSIDERPSHLVSSIVLFQSDLTPQGPIYTKLHESRLGV